MAEDTGMATSADAPRKAKGKRATCYRSAVTNGARLFLEPVDGNSQVARRFRDVLTQIHADLGGIDGLSEMQRQLARRAAMLSIAAEQMEMKAAMGEDIDMEAYRASADGLRRIVATLGLKVAARKQPSLGERLAGIAADRDAAKLPGAA